MLLQTALLYASMGWKVFPLARGSKVPREGSTSFKVATTDVEQIKQWWLSDDFNIGIATGKESNLTVIDVDGEPGLTSYRTIAKEFPKGGTRVVKTPNGHHLYFQYNPAFHTGAGFLTGLDVRTDGGYVVAPPSVVNDQQYHVLFDRAVVPIAVAPEVFLARHRNGTTPVPEIEHPTWVSELLANGVEEGQRNQSATSLAGYFHSRGIPNDIIETIMGPFAENCNPPVTQQDLRRVIESVSRYDISEEVDTEVSLAEHIREYILETDGKWWHVNDIDDQFGLKTKTEKNNRRQILHRMKNEGFVEQHQTIAKRYRHRVTQVEGLNYKQAKSGDILDIKLPLGIEEYVHLYPGNIVVIAGNSNAGKTSFMLNLIYLNDGKFPINYWCSEMEAEELGDRLDNFNVPRDSWQFRAFDRASDFEDIVVPDTINLIDYLDLDDNIYLIKKHLDAISRAIGKGLAVVAIQKKYDNELGYGSDRSLATSKLYLSMSAGKMKIVKGKVPANKSIPANGLQRRFKINDGVYFVPDVNDNGWEYDLK